MISTANTVLAFEKTDLYNCIYSYQFHTVPMSAISLSPSEREKKYLDITAYAKAKESIQNTADMEYIHFNIYDSPDVVIANGFITNDTTTNCTKADDDIFDFYKRVLFSDDESDSEGFRLFEAMANLGLGLRLSIPNSTISYIKDYLNSDYDLIESMVEPVEETAVEEVVSIEVEDVESVIIDTQEDDGCQYIEFSADFIKEYVKKTRK